MYEDQGKRRDGELVRAEIDLDDVRLGAPAIRAAFETVCGVWAILALVHLRHGPARYGELKRRLEGVSDRRLAATLKAFVGDGLTERRVLRVLPAHVEYELTPLGHEVAEAMSDLALTIIRLAPAVADARRRLADADPEA